jgi:sulfite exporter TauE/SafE
MCGLWSYFLPAYQSLSGPVVVESLPWARGFSHHLAYHFGRLATYGILGALAAGLVNIAGFNLFLNFRGGAILIGGLLIVLMGLMFLKVIPLSGPLARFSLAPSSLWDRLLPPLFQSLISKVGLGLVANPVCRPCSHAHQGSDHGEYG